jgi:uncharacterized protein (TIGR00661 family)
LKTRKRILVAPLDWGLGHATRCVPIVREFIAQGHEVLLAGSGASLCLLQQQFPDLKACELPGYHPRYPKNGHMVLAMATQLPHFIQTIKEENKLAKAIVKNENIDIVVSDNRYGFYADAAHNVFITHQLTVLMPKAWRWMQPLVNYFNHRQISHFQTCWVPAPDGLLTPDLLQHPSSIQPVFIGFLSRLSIPLVPSRYKVLALLSGPSPQREQLGEILKKQLRELDIPAVFIWGDFSGEQQTTTEGNLTEMNFADADQLNQLIGASEIIVARSGYSTVMDLIGSQKKAIFVPTPGQTEQEYLANIMHKKKIAITAPQHNFDLKAAIDATAPTSGFVNIDFSPSHLLQQAIQQL